MKSAHLRTSRDSTSRTPARRGFAMLLVLLLALGIFVMALQGATSSRAAVVEATTLRERAQSERRARAAVVVAMKAMMSIPGTEGDASRSSATGNGSTPGAGGSDQPQEPDIPDFIKALIPELAEALKKQKEEEAKDKPSNPALSSTFADGGLADRVPLQGGIRQLQRLGLPLKPIRFPFDGSTYEIELADASGLLNINLAGEQSLRAYFKAKGLDDRDARLLTDQILDYLDADDSKRADGAEREQYEDLDSTPRNGSIEVIDELLYLPAMSRDLFDLIKDDLTVVGDGKVHAGSASLAVLTAVPGLSESSAAQFIQARQSGQYTKQWFERQVEFVPTEARDVLRFETSTVIRLRVRVIEGPGAGQRFDGMAVVNDQGLADMGLRVAR